MKKTIYIVLFMAFLFVMSTCKKDNKAPSKPFYTSPINEATNQPISISLIWGCTDNDLDVLTYDVYFGTTINPLLIKSGNKTTAYNPGILENNRKYYWKIIAKDNHGNSTEGDIWSFRTQQGSGTVTDVDGNVYNTAIIGTHLLMIENLRTTKLNDGNAIPNITNNSTWTSLSSPGFCWYDNDAAKYYGALYNWYTVNTGKLCPEGWNVPTDENGTIVYSGDASEAGGYRDESGLFYGYGIIGYWWSSSESPISGEAWSRSRNYLNHEERRISYNKSVGLSVRCFKVNDLNLRPNPPSNLSPFDGAVNEPRNTSLRWTCTDPENDPMTYDVYFGTEPNPFLVKSGNTTKIYNPGTLAYNTKYYWKVVAVEMDNQINSTEGDIWSFTTELKPDSVVSCGIVNDIDGNSYNTVKSGTLCWMKENLKTTKYNDGSPIPNVIDNTGWTKLTTGAYCNYDNIANNANTYGRLYNWYAVGTGKLCPKGWHVSTAGAFTPLYGGWRQGTDGLYIDMGKWAYYWSSSKEFDATKANADCWQYNKFWQVRTLNKGLGFSVHCVKD